MAALYNGSCLCGKIKYEIDCEPQFISSCHCTMCQKQHGAAFASYITFEKKALRYVQGGDVLKSYNSSSSIERRFCGHCGSSIEWVGHPDHPDITSVAMAGLDTPFNCENITQLHQTARAPWLTVQYTCDNKSQATES